MSERNIQQGLGFFEKLTSEDLKKAIKTRATKMAKNSGLTHSTFPHSLFEISDPQTVVEVSMTQESILVEIFEATESSADIFANTLYSINISTGSVTRNHSSMEEADVVQEIIDDYKESFYKNSVESTEELRLFAEHLVESGTAEKILEKLYIDIPQDEREILELTASLQYELTQRQELMEFITLLDSSFPTTFP